MPLSTRPPETALLYSPVMLLRPNRLCRRAAALALAGAALALPACELGANFGDLGEQLLDPDIQSIDAPGRRWLEGVHFDLRQLADRNGKRYTLARNEDSELVIVDTEREHFCRAGAVAQYASEAVLSPSRPGLVPLLVQRQSSSGESLPPELTFTTFECQRTSFRVPVSGLQHRVLEGLPSGSGTGLLMKTPEGGLALVDPWEETTRAIAASVRADDPVPLFGRFLWVDQGVIVVSDPYLQPLAAFGQDVIAIAASREDAQLAYIEAPGGRLPGVLYTIDARGREEPRQIAGDVCGMRYLALDGRRTLAYVASCTERSLILRDVADGSERVLDSGVAGLPSTPQINGRSLLTYVTTPSPEVQEGTLWLVDGDGPKVSVAENTRVGPSLFKEDGGLLTVLDWESGGGRLVEWRASGLTEVAQGVIELLPLGVMDNDDLTLLGNFDGTTGDLLRLRGDLTTEVLASGVPTRAARDDAFLANFDGQTGQLMLFDRAGGGSELLASGVGRNSFLFTLQFNAVLMLADRDPETRTNTLRLRLLGSKRQYVLHDRVSEAREVAFPSPGILYNVVAGEDAGVWFAKTL